MEKPTHLLRAAFSRQDGRLLLQAQLLDERSRLTVKDWTADYGPGEEDYIPFALAGMVTASLKLPPLAIPAVNANASKDYWSRHVVLTLGQWGGLRARNTWNTPWKKTRIRHSPSPGWPKRGG